MSKTPTRIHEPTEEMQQKIIRARIAVATQQRRYILCPYCKHKSIAVFEDTRKASISPSFPNLNCKQQLNNFIAVLWSRLIGAVFLMPHETEFTQ